MSKISSIRNLFGLWPGRRQVVADIHALEVPVAITIHQINKWIEVNSIPAKYHQSVVDAAQLRGLPVDADLMVALHDRRQDEAV